MRYRIIGALTFAAVCILSLAVSLCANDTYRHRYIQHKTARPYSPCEECEGFCTHLPLIMIDTRGEEIPGRPISGENGLRTGYTKAADGSEVITADLSAVDNKDKNNHPTDQATLSSGINIRIRGNSSRYYDKPNYLIELKNEDGTNNKQPLLGMDAHHRYTLHGPFADKSLLRNYMWYNISGEIMEYSPNVRFCELMVNGEYCGLYLLTETITAGDDGARLSLSVDRKDNTFTGYVIRLDWTGEDEEKKITPFSLYTKRSRSGYEIYYPRISDITPELRKNIKDDFSAFEKAIYSYDFDNKEYGYKSLIETDSFVDYFLINELTCNYDAGTLSTYIYKDIDGRYKLCVWDFNAACDGYEEEFVNINTFRLQTGPWYAMLFKDEAFTSRVVKRYRELRKGCLSEEYMNSFIDETVSYLGPAIKRNFEVWGYTFDEEYDRLLPTDRNPRSFDEAVEQVKDFLHKRGAFMDENIDSVKQYSARSKIKQFDEEIT